MFAIIIHMEVIYVYNKGEMCYIIENNSFIREALVKRKTGEFYIVQIKGTTQVLRVRESRLYKDISDAKNKINPVQQRVPNYYGQLI